MSPSSYQFRNFCPMCGGFFSKSYKPTHVREQGIALDIHHGCKVQFNKYRGGIGLAHLERWQREQKLAKQMDRK